LLRRPAMPTLFPYTTLFRSRTDLHRLYRLNGQDRLPQSAVQASIPGNVRAQPDRQPVGDDLKDAAARVLGAVGFVHLGLHRLLRSEEHTSELQSRENLVCRL